MTAASSLGAIYPSKIGATCQQQGCRWIVAWLDVPASDYGRGGRDWTAAQRAVRNAARGHTHETGHPTLIIRTHYQTVRPL